MQIEIRNNEIYGGALDGKKVITEKKLTKNISWWGLSQIHKWRWNEAYIDLGCISIYNLKRKRFWSIVAKIIWPLRKYYHWRYCAKT